MIKANELRIGNWVQWNGPSHTEKALVSCISSEELVFLCGDSGLINEIEPIPLTEKWLIKFGFEKTSLHYFKKNNLILIVEDDCYETYLGSIMVIIKHVHQLQNLYFALIWEELEIKETTNN